MFKLGSKTILSSVFVVLTALVLPGCGKKDKHEKKGHAMKKEMHRKHEKNAKHNKHAKNAKHHDKHHDMDHDYK